jgi:putative restriction endonuclease
VKMNGPSTRKSDFAEHLRATNIGGSGKASSYMRALELLEQMLKAAPLGFGDCQDLWIVGSPERLMKLRQQVLEEQKRGPQSPWMKEGIPVSYLRDGYCSAALAQLIEFLAQTAFSEKVLGILNSGSGDDGVLAKALNISPSIPAEFVDDAASKEGKERLQSIKARIGQQTFRSVILAIYRNRCGLTGIDLPEVNRASHIIGWAERAETRMDPRNGICLSATYDAAFDRKLITFDDDFRLVLGKSMRDRVPTETLKHHFLSKEGQRLELPSRLHPLKEYLEHHRKGGEF